MSLYRGPIIDAHIHLWDLKLDRHPWLRPTGAEGALGDLAPLRRNYLMKDFWVDAANQNIAAAVYVEAGWDRARDPWEEIEWLESLDKSSGVAARYIGYADLCAPDVDATLARLAAYPRCVGVRQMLSWSSKEPARNFAPRPRIADEPSFRRGVARLAAHDLVLELMLYPYQAEEIARLARDFPEQIFVLNHCGSPVERDPAGMARWRGGLRRLGAQPNVHLKISALTAYDPAPTPESLGAVVETCLETFGVSRCMFGSDFPVGRLWTSYDAIFEGFKVMVAGLSDAEQAALFHDNARRLFRLG